MFNRYFEIKDGNTDFLYANIAVKNIYFALISLDYILNKENYDNNIYHDEHTFYFYHIQSLLTACGNISNIFYNNGFNSEYKEQITSRCKKLRESLNINKKAFPLIFQKEVRNTNEHFDERYHEFNGNVGDYNILDKNTDFYVRQRIISNPHLRTYDKRLGVYFTYGKNRNRIAYDMHKLYSELNDMLEKIMNNPIYNSGWVDNLSGEKVK